MRSLLRRCVGKGLFLQVSSLGAVCDVVSDAQSLGDLAHGMDTGLLTASPSLVPVMLLGSWAPPVILPASCPHD